MRGWHSIPASAAPILGGGTPHDSPRWTIAWWFIPIAFLVKPYLIVRDAWRRLNSPTRQAGGAVMGVWWLGFIGSTVLSRYVVFASNTSSLNALPTVYVVGIVAEGLVIVSAICGFRVVREIQRRGAERAQTLGLSVSGGLIPKGLIPTGLTAQFSIGTTATPAVGASFCPSCGVRRVAPGRYCASCGADLGPSA